MSVGIGRERQFEVYVGGARGVYPTVPVSFERLERGGAQGDVAEGYAYVAGGAGTEETMRENRAAFERWRIVPRMLRDVSTRDTAVDVLGTPLPSPFVLCPIGVLEMAHREADVAVARAAPPRGSRSSSRTRRRARWRRRRARWATRRAGSSSTGARRTSSSRASVSRRALRLLGDRAHARHDDARLADPRPRPRVPAVPPREGDRAVHERPRLRRGAAGDAPPGGRRRAVASRSRRSGRS